MHLKFDWELYLCEGMKTFLDCSLNYTIIKKGGVLFENQQLLFSNSMYTKIWGRLFYVKGKNIHCCVLLERLKRVANVFSF